MTRHEWLWLVLKALGLYFLVQGIYALVMTLTLSGNMSQGTELSGRAAWMWGPVIAQIAIGAYLTFFGEWLLGMAARTAPADEPDDDSGAGGDDDETRQRRQSAQSRIRRRRIRRRRKGSGPGSSPTASVE